ncbi:ferritin-like domain-containing protein [Aquimarina sp. 2201CG5-10]|uniref:ferritin-like domain-containing protein n=1 Tax=Aquimarina callyspongiae TaxID=3098150 RepID=UPI002AB431A5|nr:ferritin-like domain-containing protein [Aquimarina sp. 2201CG5-10]MDY8136908.1 ferritin-like domain-containing protein [Aquimarina sp. 2201CG5-10]
MINITWKNKEQNEPFIKRSLNSVLKSLNIKDRDFDRESNYIPFLDDLETNASTKEKLIALLKIASEVEHRLMAQYLFTMYSIKDDNIPVVLDIKMAIKEIAIQEMGHLLGVQNLLLSLGGIESLHLHKDLILSDSKENPIPFNLENFSIDVLAGYLIVETPEKLPTNLKEEINKIRIRAEKHFSGSIKSVGGLYKRIFWMFQESDLPPSDPRLMQLSPNGRDLISDDHVSLNDFRPIEEIERYEAFKSLWNNGGNKVAHFGLTLSKVHSHRDALYLTNYIAEQGEGEDFVDVDSHFERFFNAYKAIEAYIAIEGAKINVYKTPKNLSTKRQENRLQNIIENKYSIYWVELYNLCYNSLLLDIFSSFKFKGETNYSENEVIELLVYKSMIDILGKMSEVLFKLPFNSGDFYYDKEPRCGPTFEIEKDFNLSTDINQLIDYSQTILDRIQDRISKIESHDDYSKHQELDFDVALGLHISNVNIYIENKQNIINPFIS